ncbi:hypothetical protein TNCV_4227041 [Trichonephila clavipes]|nr:hypothetical protein TNCV_4227041 [Trichonephila clavipes]
MASWGINSKLFDTFKIHPVVSRETIRRLTDLYKMSRRPLRRLPLTPHPRQCRLEFFRPQANWSVTEWRCVIFSKESRFSLARSLNN